MRNLASSGVVNGYLKYAIPDNITGIDKNNKPNSYITTDMLVKNRQSYSDYLDYFSDLADLQLIKKISKFKRVFGTELSIGTLSKKRFEANNVKIDLKIKFDLIAV